MENLMISRRMLFTLVIASACALGTAQVSLAKNSHHNNGHNLLGAKLNQDGRHEIARIGNNPVTAEVKGKKVVNMSAGNLAVRKVQSNKKMAGQQIGNLKLAANGEIQIAQADVYYGYCFDSGIDQYCYWYPATDVIVTDTWIVYSP
jgi:hypothetical protein